MTRRTPTERQVDALRELSEDELLQVALDSLHALNRRAKEKRDRAGKYRRANFANAVKAEMERIYVAKTSFCDALVRAGKAEVETFTIMGRPYWSCDECGRTWGGDDDECRGCHGYGTPEQDEESWFVVAVGPNRWHQPEHEATPAIRAAAKPAQPHQPAQPQREIPTVEAAGLKLTIEAQFQAINLATHALLVVARHREAKGGGDGASKA